MSQTAFKDLLYPNVEESLSNKRNRDEYITIVKKYIDDNTQILSTLAIHKRLLMNDDFKNKLIALSGLDDRQVKTAVKASSYVDEKWRRATSTFSITCLLVARYGILDGTTHGQELAYIALMSLAYQMYSSAHYQTYEREPSEEVTNYALTKLKTQHFLKQTGSIHGMLDKTVTGSYLEKYTEDLKEGSDKSITKLISGLKDRVNSLVYNIGDIVHDAARTGKYMYQQSDDRSEDNYRIADNNMYVINTTTANTTVAVCSGDIDFGIVKASVALNPGASDSKVESMLRIITRERRPEVSKMIEYIMVNYMLKTRNARISEFKSERFLSESLLHYRSNASDGLMVKIKDLLDDWQDNLITKSSIKISKSRSSADAYKRALYTFLVLSIMENI